MSIILFETNFYELSFFKTLQLIIINYIYKFNLFNLVYGYIKLRVYILLPLLILKYLELINLTDFGWIYNVTISILIIISFIKIPGKKTVG